MEEACWTEMSVLGREILDRAEGKPHTPRSAVKRRSGCRKSGGQKEFDHFFFRFSGLFWSLFLMLLSLFSSLFCQAPFAEVLLRQGEKGPGEEGAARNHPEISSQKLADFECRFPYDSYGRDRAPFSSDKEARNKHANFFFRLRSRKQEWEWGKRILQNPVLKIPWMRSCWIE